MQSPETFSLHPGSSPIILDLDMEGSRDPDIDFEFFDANLPLDAATPSGFLTDDFSAASPRNPAAFGSPAPTNNKKLLSQQRSPVASKPVVGGSKRQNGTLSARSSTSPAASFQDSSSDSSRRKRKSSSDSSRSALTGRDGTLADTDADMADWKADDMMTGGDGPSFGGFDGTGTINPASMNSDFGFTDKSMENDFDFESAASSPSPFGIGPVDMESPEIAAIKYDTANKSVPKPSVNIKRHSKAYSQHSVTQSMKGLTTSTSREESPLSAMVTSQESSPSAYFNNSPSPDAGLDFISGQMLKGVSQQNPAWQSTFGFPQNAVPGVQVKAERGPIANVPSPLSTGRSMMDKTFRPTLTIHPTPLKSRVETQIPIKMTLCPIPAGVTKLHLPTHTISKPKLLTKPSPERSPDTLELYTTLVCTSAMQNPEFRRRALARAAGPAPPDDNRADKDPEASSDADDENKPLNGGEVKICAGCITRERKRAARKKVKKVEEEESWHKDEHKRAIVFNTQEVKEWQLPSSQISTEATGDRLEPMVPEGALQVDAPMRIACYCRHQNEKLGFQVIFTIKDYKDRMVAQEMTSSIMITDDHKTHTMPAMAGQASNTITEQAFGNAIFPPDANFDLPMAPFRTSHSSSDLQTLQRNYNMQFGGGAPLSQTTSNTSQATSTAPTPRNLSRQASPSGSVGPTAKKRKSSTGKVPSGLAMTRLETGPSISGPSTAGGSVSASTSTAPSPYTPGLGGFSLPNDATFGQSNVSLSSVPQQFHTGPPTPNSNDQGFFSNTNRSQSMENLAMQHQMYSAPTSAHQSRAPSPTGLRNSVQSYQQQQAHIAQAVANGLYGMPLALNPHRPPTIHKLIPNEGPISGGVEVTCLGSGFCQGLEVMFGDSMATTSTYWGETSIVCLLPPAALAGSVPVTFKHQHQQQQMQPYPTPPIPKQQVFFKYVDDQEQQIIRMALSVLGHKMTGKMEDVRDLARRIVGDGSPSWGMPSGQSPPGGSQSRGANQHHHNATFGAASFGADVEATLLKCLDLIDLDDSANMPRWNLRRPTGQTMLHLACALGLHRFAAALLARGANPDPRDKGGFTPMHFAALHGHPQIVRRLILNGADPTMRNLRGYTPSDLARSEEVLRSTRRVEHHSRTRSGGTLRSRASSATSIRSLWEHGSQFRLSKNPTAATRQQIDDIDTQEQDSDDDSDDSTDEDADSVPGSGYWMASRRGSARHNSTTIVDPHQHLPSPMSEGPPNSATELPMAMGEPSSSPPPLPSSASHPSHSHSHSHPPPHPSALAAMAAFRDQLSAQIQYLQHSMHANLPQMPALPVIPNYLQDYQAYLPAASAPMVRRISSLVPHRVVNNNNNNSRPGTADQGEEGGSSSPRSTQRGSPPPPPPHDGKWWDMFSGPTAASHQAAAPPPAYEDIFPEGNSGRGADVDLKRSSAARAAADVMADEKCAGLFDGDDNRRGRTAVEAKAAATASSSSAGRLALVGESSKAGSGQQQQQQQRSIEDVCEQYYAGLTRAVPVKKLGSDRKLFFVWIPILLVIIMAMLYSRVPQIWHGLTQIADLARAHAREDTCRVVQEVQ